MVHESGYSMVITTCGDKESAKRLADVLVASRLVACAQLLPIESIYIWNGEVCNENETMILLKTKTLLFDKLEAVIRENHTYEVPEIIELPITDGLPEYLRWISECVRKHQIK